MKPGIPALILALVFLAESHAVAAGEVAVPAQGPRSPMTVGEAKAFMRRLAAFVLEHHVRKDDSAHRGMVYEYFWVEKKGTVQQWIQGEALDTMHDGAWFGAALVNAYAATGDAFYRDALLRLILPFYVGMLNRSDELFTNGRNDGRPGDDRGWRSSKEWLLQSPEKGFIPYWWDDGSSVSLDMLGRRDGDRHVNFAARNDWGDGPNPDGRLKGYSFGSSNHMAQDIAVLLLQAHRLLIDARDGTARDWLPKLADAARNLQACRERHGYGNIPAVRAALAAATGDEAVRRSLPDETWKTAARARSHYRKALFEHAPGERVRLPGFADDQQYNYHVAITRERTLRPPAAFRLAYDAYTIPLLYRMYCDDEPAPAGINIFDLHPYHFVDGRPEDYRSQRKGPHGRPRPVGSRLGPQNMVISALALQALKAMPTLWPVALAEIQETDFFPESATAENVRAALEREVGLGLRTWEAIFDQHGYIPTGIGCNSVLPGVPWDRFSDTGGYAHLISAAAQWIFYLEDKQDWTARCH